MSNLLPQTKTSLTLICITETSMHLAAITVHAVCVRVCVCVLWSCPPLCSNRSGIGLNMAAWSLVHHTSQPQPLSADYKLQSRLQIMTKDVLARLEDVQQKTHTHTHTPHTNTCLHMHTQIIRDAPNH